MNDLSHSSCPPHELPLINAHKSIYAFAESCDNRSGKVTIPVSAQYRAELGLVLPWVSTSTGIARGTATLDDLSLFNTSWILLCAFLVTTMQIGFCMLEAGLVRQKNSINVAYKNLMDFVVAGLVYWAVGYGIMYGAGHASGFFGTDLFLKSHSDGEGAFFLYQLVFCSAAATIVGGALAERTRLSGYLIISAMVAAFIYPLVGHWAWGGILENGAEGWLAARGFIDFAGSTVVHGTGGWLALAAVIVVGPRIGRFDSDTSLRGSNYPVATVGVLVLWFGWFGFNGGSLHRFDASVPSIVVNTSLSAAAGGFCLLAWAWMRDRKPDIAASINGTIAGLVGVTAGAHVYEATSAVLVGAICAVACGFATKLLERLRIDDVIGAWPAHAVAGATGTLLVAFLGNANSFPMDHSRIEQFVVQLTGVAAVAAWAFGGGYVLLFALNKILPLRVSAADEIVGLNISEHDASTDILDLVTEMNTQRVEGDFSTAVSVEPHTEVGQIATEYNRVLERVRLEIETREEAYSQLEEASEFRFIFENTHEGIVQFARDGKIMKANPAAVALLGFTGEDELIRRGGVWLTGLDGIDRKAHLDMLRVLKARGIVREIEMSFKRRVDGRGAEVQLDLRSVVGDGDTETRVLGSLLDISERKANDRLRIERDSATTASRAKSEFLANMSHEIRTPLNGVTGMLELLSRTQLDDRQSRFVDIAGTSADALLSVINDILDVSKIEAGKLELDSAAFTLPDLLADVVDMFAPNASSKNIELACMIPTNLPERVVGDPERLRQVLVNLLGNAVKFTERGTVTLTARVLKTHEESVDIRIEVEDNGQGIASHELERLFEPFTQADGSATRKHGGTGLGLTISRQLVELMGGTIGVESVVGEGTTFNIELTLPVIEAQAPPVDRLNESSETSVSGNNRRVLAVDDHPINLELLEGLLENEGFEVVSVDGAANAMKELERAVSGNNPFALALLDYQMPETDGGELARRIRADVIYDPMRLIMLTSIDQALSAAECRELRIHSSITKPLRRSRLFDAIDEALGLSSAERAPAELSSLTDSGSAGTGREADIEVAAAMGFDAITRDDLNSNEHGSVAAAQEWVQPETGGKLNVLIVEDNPVNQVVVQELMLAADYSVKIAENGAEALEIIAQGEVEFVLMDCQMPVMDGFEATIRIRELEKENGKPRLPIVAVTANAIVGDRERCLEAGMDDYITKPIDTERLQNAMNQLLPSDT